jgi:integrase
MITTAAKTGLRQGELLGLRWEDVDLRAGRHIGISAVRSCSARMTVGC